MHVRKHVCIHSLPDSGLKGITAENPIPFRGVSRKLSRGVLNYRRALARAIFEPRLLIS